VRFKRMENDADLRISGGPKDGLQVTIEVPSSAMLYVWMPAGDLTLKSVSGDKDVELHAGDLAISVGNPADYGRVDPSVMAGDLEAARLMSRTAACSVRSRSVGPGSTGCMSTSVPGMSPFADKCPCESSTNPFLGAVGVAADVCLASLNHV
jgi:hypothetical protein